LEIFDNITKAVKDDLTVTIEKGSRLSIAAACFSIYAYQVLKKQFDQIDELRFIFTSPAFVSEKAPVKSSSIYNTGCAQWRIEEIEERIGGNIK
jgi:hypothetical protein